MSDLLTPRQYWTTSVLVRTRRTTTARSRKWTGLGGPVGTLLKATRISLGRARSRSHRRFVFAAVRRRALGGCARLTATGRVRGIAGEVREAGAFRAKAAELGESRKATAATGAASTLPATAGPTSTTDSGTDRLGVGSRARVISCRDPPWI